jgi:hypothetical protein
MTHKHDWYVLDPCRDYCRICTQFKRVCPPRHRHVSWVRWLEADRG